VLLLTVRGRRTGTRRTTPNSYVEHGGGYVVIGSAAGLPEDPQWFKNLRKASQAEIEVGRTRRTVDVRVLTGEERDRVWREVVLARAPVFERYVQKSGRTMPLAILTPVG
jgi:deazaflavin-dependent oxidoreductase (nitroreductase family)